MVVVNGKPLKVKVKGWRYYYAEDETGNVILDFHDIRGRNMALDENGALRKPEDWENMDFCSDHEGDFSSKRLNKCFIYGGKQVMWKKTDPADLDKDALYSPVYINDTVADISDDNTGKNYNSLTFTELLQLSSPERSSMPRRPWRMTSTADTTHGWKGSRTSSMSSGRITWMRTVTR